MKGIVHYLAGDRNLFQAALAMFSMRQVSELPCTCVCARDVPDWWIDLCHADVIRDDVDGLSRSQIWVRKVEIIPQLTPYDLTISLDVDILWNRDIPKDAWEIANERGLATGTAAGDPCGDAIQKRVASAMFRIFGTALDSIEPVGGYCVGFKRGHLMVSEWQRCMRQIMNSKGTSVVHRTPDENSLSYLVQIDRAGQMGICRNVRSIVADRPITHFNQRWYWRMNQWRRVYRRASAKDFCGLHSARQRYLNCTSQLS